jgi:hypothetical protein
MAKLYNPAISIDIPGFRKIILTEFYSLSPYSNSVNAKGIKDLTDGSM